MSYSITNAKDAVDRAISSGESRLSTVLGVLDDVKVIPPQIEHLKENAKYALDTLYHMREFLTALPNNLSASGGDNSVWLTNGVQSGNLSQVINNSINSIYSWLTLNNYNRNAPYMRLDGSGIKTLPIFHHQSNKRKAGGVKVMPMPGGSLKLPSWKWSDLPASNPNIPVEKPQIATISLRQQAKEKFASDYDSNVALAQSLNHPPADDGWRLTLADCDPLKPPVWDQSEGSAGKYNQCVDNNNYLQQKGYIGLKRWENDMRLDIGDQAFDNDPVAKVDWLKKKGWIPYTPEELDQKARSLMQMADDHNARADRFTAQDQSILYNNSKLQTDRIWEGLGMGAKLAAMILTLPIIGFSGPIALGLNAAALGIQSITDAAQGKSASSIGDKWANFAIDQAKGAVQGYVSGKVTSAVKNLGNIKFNDIQVGGAIKRQRMERKFKRSIRTSIKG